MFSLNKECCANYHNVLRKSEIESLNLNFQKTTFKVKYLYNLFELLNY